MSHTWQIIGICAMAIALGAIALPIFPSAIETVKCGFKRILQNWLIFVGVIVSILWAGTKPSPTKPFVTWDSYLHDNGSVYSNTNTYDGVLFKWTANLGVPSSSTVYIESKSRQAADVDAWTREATTTIGAWQYSLSKNYATNYVYFVWTDYVPPVPVHTNGVWLGTILEKAKGSIGVENVIVIQGSIIKNGKQIAPYKEEE